MIVMAGTSGSVAASCPRDRQQTASLDLARRPAASRRAMSVLVISGAAIRLGGRSILNGADLTVDQGRRIGLVGRNGAGKSTLLRAIAGEQSLDGGDIRLAARARVATVAQE